MREAFRKAAEQNPNSPTTKIVKGVAQSQWKERQAQRHARELEKLGGRFEYIGKKYLSHRVGSYVSISMRALKEEWHELPPLLANIEESERPELISSLAKGLMLSENLNSSYHSVVAARILNNSLDELSQMLSRKRFSMASLVFFDVISDISGHSKEQKASFRDFMNKRDDLHGSVSLPQVFPAVAEWLVQQNNAAKQA